VVAVQTASRRCYGPTMDRPPARKPSIGLVGCGRWGRHILRDLVSLGARVSVVLPSDRNRAFALAAGAGSVVRTVDDLPAVHGIVVASPTTTHEDVVRSVLGRLVPIYVEKPLTDRSRTARELAGVAGDRLFVMHKWRYHPGIEALGAIAKSGELGRVVGLRCTRIGWGNPHGDVDGIWMLAPHDISIALEVLGHIPDPRSAVAERLHGTITGLVAILGVDPWLATDLSTSAGVQRREVRLIASEGIASLSDAYSDHVVVTRGSVHGRVTREDDPRPISTELPLLRELRAFLHHLEGGPPPKSSAQEGAAEVHAISQMRRLAGLGEPSVIG
jgi:predicted dehydrogenase